MSFRSSHVGRCTKFRILKNSGATECMKIKDPHSDHDGDDSMVTSNMMAQKTVGNILRKDMDKNGYKYVEKMFCNLISFQV